MATQLRWLHDGYRKLRIFSISPRSTVQPRLRQSVLMLLLVLCVILVCQKAGLGLLNVRSARIFAVFSITENIGTLCLCLTGSGSCLSLMHIMNWRALIKFQDKHIILYSITCPTKSTKLLWKLRENTGLMVGRLGL
jgi:hypothetical protein